MPTTYVLDASVFIEHGTHPLPEGTLLTLPSVCSEVKDTTSQYRLAAVQYVLAEPLPESVQLVKPKLLKTRNALSKTDIELLALAFERKATLITDDYALQNAATLCGVLWRSWGKKGIKRVRR